MSIKQKVDLLFRQAEGALDASDFDRAIALMTKAIALPPRTPRSCRAAARCTR